MKYLLILWLLISFHTSFCQVSDGVEKKIFIYGGGNADTFPTFIKYIAGLTGKQKPKICFVPTASGDNPALIITWYEACADLEIEPHVLRVWINSIDQQESWEDILTGMDAIFVSGGNTLNMLSIWKAQGIDTALKKAYEQGVVMSGASAGSLCWFVGGTTDSRPKALSLIQGLGFLPYSHCPHYDAEAARRPLFHKNILAGKLGDGYACDNNAGILFINGKAVKAVSVDEQHHSYYVYNRAGKVIEEKMEAEIIQ